MSQSRSPGVGGWSAPRRRPVGTRPWLLGTPLRPRLRLLGTRPWLLVGTPAGAAE